MQETTMGSEKTKGAAPEIDSEQHQQLSGWLQDEFDYRRPRPGDLREAVILDIGENDVIVDIGDKQDGIVPHKDLEMLDRKFRESLRVGQHVPVVVLTSGGQQDEIRVSLHMGQQQGDWLRAADLQKRGEPVEVKIVEANQGGVIVAFGRLRGFVPNSQLAALPRGLDEDRLREAKAALVGRTVHAVVIEVEQQRRRLVLSERKAGRQRREQVLEELSEGEVRTGTVTNLAKFGAFVDLGGGVDGLIHVSELDWKHVEHPREVLSVGDTVEVQVLQVDRERSRIGLSRKRLLPDPWHKTTESLSVGQVISGRVIHATDFGLFVGLGQGIEGLVHRSEIPAEAGAPDAWAPGTSITVRVLEIDHDRRRIALSLRGI